MVSCIIVAAGSGSRMNCEDNKVILKVNKKTILEWTLEEVLKTKQLKEVVVVVSEKDLKTIEAIIQTIETNIPIRTTIGGKTRQESVYNGLQTIKEKDIVLVHDAARPLAKTSLFNEIVSAVVLNGSVIPTVPVKDTIKIVESKKVESTPERASLVAVQTPQGFKYELLKDAYDKAVASGFVGTDDASIVENAGYQVFTISGDYKNLKLTTKDDLVKIKHYLGEQKTNMRIGFGYDVHRFKEGRPCILGGVLIDSPIGPDGHSDADVILHALMDALLGAAGLRDIGYYFPPDDDSFEGISSLILLGKVRQLLMEEGYEASNVDIMVIAETPKLNPHIEEMKSKISQFLGLSNKNISIKATTNEQLGSIGRKEGIAAQAVAMIKESEEN